MTARERVGHGATPAGGGVAGAEAGALPVVLGEATGVAVAVPPDADGGLDEDPEGGDVPQAEARSAQHASADPPIARPAARANGVIACLSDLGGSASPDR
ncbi:MAG TPA: hypothetical protein VMI33_21080 [Streptosporangiaceae bacterium]|nr:hypothetical protein [Streptosporangiaceae bacterium]